MNNEYVGPYVHRLSRALRNAVSSAVQKSGSALSEEQSRLLGFLSGCSGEQEFVYQKDIETHFGVRRSSVASILSNLERGGYITREPDISDSRKKRVYLTDKGRAEVEVIRSEIGAMESVLVSGMTLQEQKDFVRTLKKCLDNLEKYDKEYDC